MALRNSAGQVLLLAICLSGLLLCLCNPEKATETKTLNFGEFTITVPSAWQPLNEKGIDSFVGRIALTDGDTISFDLGWYSNPLEEEVPYKVDEKNVYLLDQSKSTSNSRTYDFYGRRDTVDVEQFHKNKITWSTIDGRKAKVIEAKLPGDGMTGIYIDSVWRAGSGIDRFQLNGTDLTPANQQALLAAIQTLKFIDRHSIVSLDNNIVGVWRDEWSSKPSFSIDKDSIYYLQTFVSAKYDQRGDSVTLTYKDRKTKAKMFRIHKDTLIYEFDGIARKSWRFKN